MDPIVLAFIGVSIFVGVLYLSDRPGWNATAKRLSRMVRAQIEAGKPVKALESRHKQTELTQWEADFKAIEKPSEAEEPKHVIVQHRYKNAFNGAWPEWVCKCGASGSTPTGVYSDAETHRKARLRGERHVKSMNEAEERLKKNGGKFAW